MSFIEVFQWVRTTLPSHSQLSVCVTHIFSHLHSTFTFSFTLKASTFERLLGSEWYASVLHSDAHNMLVLFSRNPAKFLVAYCIPVHAHVLCPYCESCGILLRALRAKNLTLPARPAVKCLQIYTRNLCGLLNCGLMEGLHSRLMRLSGLIQGSILMEFIIKSLNEVACLISWWLRFLWFNWWNFPSGWSRWW